MGLYGFNAQRRQRLMDERDEAEILADREAEEQWKQDTVELFDAKIDDLLDEFTESQVQVIADCYLDDEEWFRNAIIENLNWRRRKQNARKV